MSGGDEPATGAADATGATNAELVVVSGLSGSGKTTALRALEDLGFFCVDNLPAPLLQTFLRLADDHDAIDRVAVAMDVREASFFSDLARHLGAVESAQRRMTVLFIDCDDDRAIARFKETRREHPLLASRHATTLAEAITEERAWLRPIRGLASKMIDTTDLNVHQLKKRVRQMFGGPGPRKITLQLMSFGFRHGIPREADYVFDVRFIPNPYFVAGLRDLGGVDAPVAEYVLAQPSAVMMLDHIEALLIDVLPLSEEEGKSAIVVAIGCTGGQHRSVALVEALRDRLVAASHTSSVSHRDLRRSISAGAPSSAQ